MLGVVQTVLGVWKRATAVALSGAARSASICVRNIRFFSSSLLAFALLMIVANAALTAVVIASAFALSLFTIVVLFASSFAMIAVLLVSSFAMIAVLLASSFATMVALLASSFTMLASTSLWRCSRRA